MTDELVVWRDQVLSELYAVAADPHATYTDLEDTLGTLYRTAEAQGEAETMEFALTVMDKVDTLLNTANTAISIASAARKVAQEIQTQRDEVIDELQTAQSDLEETRSELEQLESDIKWQNRMNPLVDELLDEVYEEVRESVWIEADNNGTFMTDDPEHDICGIGEIPCDPDDATHFFTYLTGHAFVTHWLTTDEEKQELADFITDFVAKVKGRHALEEKKANEDYQKWVEANRVGNTVPVFGKDGVGGAA